MKVLKILLLSMIVTGLVFSVATASKHTPEERGKALFNDPKFAGATAGKSCATCHPKGQGLEAAGEKKEFKIMGKSQKSLEEAVNFCIEGAIKGKPIDPKSDQMNDMVAYIKSLKGKAKAKDKVNAPAEKPKKKKIEGC